MRKKVVIGKKYKQTTKVEKQITQPTKGWKQVDVLGIKINIRKYKLTAAKDFIKYNKEIVKEFIKKQEERTGRKITNVEQYVRNYVKPYKQDWIDFVKKAAAPVDLRYAAQAYDLLVQTGSIEELQAQVNEEIVINKIHYIGDNNYEYIGNTRKCKFRIHYVSGANSYVWIEIFTGEDK